MPDAPKVGESGTHTVDRGGSDPTRSPNDDRSDVHNPNNPAHAADQANREKQGGK
jgi:hypothetical protein